jgi:hypothetical protein
MQQTPESPGQRSEFLTGRSNPNMCSTYPPGMHANSLHAQATATELPMVPNRWRPELDGAHPLATELPMVPTAGDPPMVRRQRPVAAR